MGGVCPADGGLLDLTLPWATLAGESSEPGYLNRLGPITPSQAGYLARLAARDPVVDWRVIVTGTDGRVIAVSRVPRQSAGPAEPVEPAERASRDDPNRGVRRVTKDQAGLLRRVTVTIPQDDLSQPSPGGLSPALIRMLAVAQGTAACASERAAADAAAGGCAHSEASPAYQPSPRLREFVTARDLTCRFPTCRQPAGRCDLDHTTPHDQGGKTCSCNLGGLCRYHHQLKQRPRWRLAQPAPGTFTWTTPAGRAYSARPDSHR
jgi:hypothetical protein